FAHEPAVRVDDEGRTLDAAHLPAVQVLLAEHVECPTQRLVGGGDELEGELQLRLEVRVRLQAVARNAQHDGPRIDEGFVQVAEVGALPRAAGRVVLRAEVQDEPAPCQVGRVVDFTAGGSGAESGNRTADLNAQRTPGCGRSDALRRCEPNIPQAPAALTGGQQRGERAPAFAGE